MLNVRFCASLLVNVFVPEAERQGEKEKKRDSKRLTNWFILQMPSIHRAKAGSQK